MMGRILRANQVEFVGPLQLTIDQSGPACTGGPPGAASSRVRMVENTPSYALLEITCSCGKTTQVRCEYAPSDMVAAGEGSVDQ